MSNNFPLPTPKQAFDLGREAAKEGYGQDCNPWKNDPEAEEQMDQWNLGWLWFHNDHE